LQPTPPWPHQRAAATLTLKVRIDHHRDQFDAFAELQQGAVFGRTETDDATGHFQHEERVRRALHQTGEALCDRGRIEVGIELRGQARDIRGILGTCAADGKCRCHGRVQCSSRSQRAASSAK
jgi:hypothetical protein